MWQIEIIESAWINRNSEPEEPPEDGEIWDDIALQTQDSKFEPWRSEAEQTTSRSRRLHMILNISEWAGKNIFVSLKLEGQDGARTHDLQLSKQAALTTAPGPPPIFLGIWYPLPGIWRHYRYALWEWTSAILRMLYYITNTAVLKVISVG